MPFVTFVNLLTRRNSITLISLVNSLQQQANFSWTPYVTSSFKFHGLTGITTLVANLVSGVSKLPLAKFIDVVGRPQGFAICLLSVLLCTYSHSTTRLHNDDDLQFGLHTMIDTDREQLL